MKKLYWWSRAIFQEMQKRKFKAIFKYFYDTKYRGDVNYLFGTLSGKRFTTIDDHVLLRDIKHSHSITYTSYVIHLAGNLICSRSIPTIKVVKTEKGLIVVDGNHRLAAMRLAYEPGKTVKVRRLVEIKV